MSSSIPDPVPEGATPEQMRHIINYWRIEAYSTEQRYISACLAAESGNALVKQLKDQLAEAKAENERLRKAGDAMALAYCNLDVDGYEEESAEMLMQTLPTLKAWVAAKEGRDAK